MTLINDPWMAAACHEAGHAVAGLVLGWELEHVVVYPRGGATPMSSNGCTKFVATNDWRRHVAVLLAGGAAYVSLDPDGRFIEDENGYAVHLEDIGRARRQLADRFPDMSDGRRERRLDIWRCFVRKLVAAPANRRAIVAIAEALRDNGWHLGGPTATEIARAARRSAPGRAKGA